MIEPILLRERSLEPADLLGAMEKIRGIELALRDASVAGSLEGPLHVSLGEEAVAVGIAAALRLHDVLLSNHRGHGHALGFGLDVATTIAEIVGHPSGFAAGRGGSMHIFEPSCGFLGTNGIVGGNAGVAVGAGLALQIEAKERVAVVVFGDGAMGTGIVYESLNLAVLWRLPVVFICENNGYAEMTPTSTHLSSSPVERARGFGIPAEGLDGIDVEAMIKGVTDAVAKARQGMPVFLEARCCRFGGHYAADPARYRPPGEDDEWGASHCPIKKLSRKLGQPDVEVDRRIDNVRAEAARNDQAVHGMNAKFWHGVNNALKDAMAVDPSIVLFGQDVGGPGGPYGLTRGLQQAFGPSRVRDTPISEGALMGCAVGAAMLGLRPVVEIMFLDFIALALDQLANNAAKYRFYMPKLNGRPASLPIVVRTLYGGRASMGPQHSQALEAWLCHIPGIKVAFPSSPQTAYDVLRSAIDDPDPVVIIESIAGLANIGELDVGTYRPGAMAPGTSRVLRTGQKATVVTYGPTIALCEQAIEMSGIDAELIDLCWLQPWDFETVKASVEKTNRLVVVHDAVEGGGVGGEIAARVGQECFWHLDAPIMRVGALFSPIPVRKRDWTEILPTTERIVAALKEVAYS